MNFKKIKNDYAKKIKILLSHNKNYYDKNDPKISDKEYDDLKKEILKFEKNMISLKMKIHLLK